MTKAEIKKNYPDVIWRKIGKVKSIADFGFTLTKVKVRDKDGEVFDVKLPKVPLYYDYVHEYILFTTGI